MAHKRRVEVPKRQRFIELEEDWSLIFDLLKSGLSVTDIAEKWDMPRRPVAEFISTKMAGNSVSLEKIPAGGLQNHFRNFTHVMEPIVVTRWNIPVAVVMNIADYEKLTKSEVTHHD